MTAPPVAVEEVTKTYAGRFPWSDGIPALSGVSFELHAGEIFGLLGPNGAGKTTLIHLLLGFLHASTGRIRVFGRLPGDPVAKERLGYLPEDPGIFRSVTVGQFLQFMAGLFENRMAAQARIPALLESLGLSAFRNTPVRRLSKGETQRLGLAQALLNDPALLILDEPTSGLDPLGRAAVKTLLKELQSKGKTVLLCSHILTDIEELCDRIVILDHGIARATGPIAAVLSQVEARNLDEAFVLLVSR